MALAPFPDLLKPARFKGQVGGRRTALFLLKNSRGMVVAVTNLGAKVLQIIVPDRHGDLGDVTLGYDSLDGVLNGAPSMGAFIGRYAGRIAQARFELDGAEHRLPANAGPHCIHGGPHGSRYQVFGALQATGHTLELHHVFDTASDGFPGRLDLRLSYQLTDDNALMIHHEARITEGCSPASFTSHIFFNLDSAGSGSIDHHHLEVQAAQLLVTDADNVCTGQQLVLDGHPLDLRKARRLDDLPGLDHAYVTLPGPLAGVARRVARVDSPASGRTLEVWSTEPVLQVYTAGALGTGDQPDRGKRGVRHRPRSGICLEAQQFPNAPNCPAFPLNLVTPECPYRATTVYRLGVSS